MSKQRNNAAWDELTAALEAVASGPYKGTAAKFELEAQLNRGNGYDDNEACDSCDGEGRRYCDYCEEGTNTCDDCNGTGTVDVDGDEGQPATSEECSRCSGEGYMDCSECDGCYDWSCEDCDGDGTTQSTAGWGVLNCFNFMLEHVCQKLYGQSVADRLAELGGFDYRGSSHDNYDISAFNVIEGLHYAEFYRDGSVDSEFTFTVDFEHISLAMEFMKAFKALAEEIGNGLDTEGAGMHIAILNSPNRRYPGDNHLNETYTNNFVRAVTPLLPALYFLGSADYRSRDIGFRKPYISSPWHAHADKYAAINGRDGCFEFRVFETCYQKPEAVIDYLLVIAKALSYYKREAVDTSMKLGRLGWKDSGRGISRFYYTQDHLKALDRGLELLKPNYKSVVKLKTERGFEYSASDFKKLTQERRKEWEQQYEGVKIRLTYERSRRYHRFIADYYEVMEGLGREAMESQYGSPQQYASRRVRENYGHLYGGIRGYIREQQRRFNENDVEYYIEV